VDERELNSTIEELSKAAWNVVRALPDRPSILGYSGGIDSGILAALATQCEKNVSLLTRGRIGSSDVTSVQKYYGTKSAPVVSVTDRSEIERAANQVVEITRVSSLSHFEDCVAFWLIAENAEKLRDNGYIISANGPDELFCGYDRFRRLVD